MQLIARSSLSILLVLILLLVLGCSDDSDTGNNPPPETKNNKVRIECPIIVTAPENDTTITIDVHFTNDTNIGGFTLGFSYNSENVEITAVTAGPALQSDSTIYVGYHPEENQVLVLWVDASSSNPIPPGDDIRAFSLVMAIPAGTAVQTVDIDSTFVPPSGRFVFAFQEGGDVTPQWINCGNADISIE